MKENIIISGRLVATLSIFVSGGYSDGGRFKIVLRPLHGDEFWAVSHRGGIMNFWENQKEQFPELVGEEVRQAIAAARERLLSRARTVVQASELETLSRSNSPREWGINQRLRAAE